MAENTPQTKTYRLVLDFEVWANDELTTTQWDEEGLDQEERKHLAAQRQCCKRYWRISGGSTRNSYARGEGRTQAQLASFRCVSR